MNLRLRRAPEVQTLRANAPPGNRLSQPNHARSTGGEFEKCQTYGLALQHKSWITGPPRSSRQPLDTDYRRSWSSALATTSAKCAWSPLFGGKFRIPLLACCSSPMKGLLPVQAGTLACC